MSSENVERSYRGYDAINRRDLDAVLALMHEDVEVQSLLVAVEGGYRGHEGVRRWWRNLIDVFPDFTIELLEMRELGDFTVMELRWRGHGAGSDAPIDTKMWQAGHWREGRLAWWGSFTTKAAVLKAVKSRTAAASNVDIVRSVFDAAARRDSEAVLDFYDPDVEVDFSRSPQRDVMSGHVFHGHEGLRRWFREWTSAWESIEDSVDEVIPVGEHVVSVATSRGRGRASGLGVEYRAAGVWTIEDGKVTRVAWFPSREEALKAADEAG